MYNKIYSFTNCVIDITPDNKTQRATAKVFLFGKCWVDGFTVYQIKNGDFKIGVPSLYRNEQSIPIFSDFNSDGKVYFDVIKNHIYDCYVKAQEQFDSENKGKVSNVEKNVDYFEEIVSLSKSESNEGVM